MEQTPGTWSRAMSPTRF